jgi:glycogen operon protein
VKLGEPDWSHDSHSLVLEAKLQKENLRVYLLLNAYWDQLEFELPLADDIGLGAWRRWIDTSLESPEDIAPWQAAPLLLGSTYRAEARSVVVLLRQDEIHGMSI